MFDRNDGRRVLLAVNSTEWANLCARGSIRMLRCRAVELDSGHQGELDAVFATAPTTKPGSSIDSLVLELLPDWRERAEAHPAREDVAVLGLDDVVSHHVVASEHLDYYRGQADKTGVTISDRTFEPEWRRWAADEAAAAATAATKELWRALHLENGTYQPCEALISAVARSGDRSEDASLAVRLVSAAGAIDDGAAATRSTEAYYLATVIEWIDIVESEDALESLSGGAVLRHVVSSARELEWTDPPRLSNDSRAALRYLEAVYSSAFDECLTPLLVGLLTRITVEARTGRPKPSTLIGALCAARGESAHAARTCSTVIAAAVGPEYVRQLLPEIARGQHT